MTRQDWSSDGNTTLAPWATARLQLRPEVELQVRRRRGYHSPPTGYYSPPPSAWWGHDAVTAAAPQLAADPVARKILERRFVEEVAAWLQIDTSRLAICPEARGARGQE